MKSQLFKSGRGIAFIVAACVTVLALVFGTVAAILVPSSVELVPSGQGNVQTVSSSLQNGEVYYADSRGCLYRADDPANRFLQVTDGIGISKILTDAKADVLFCTDANNRVYVVRDGEEGLQLLSRSENPIQLERVLADDAYIYLIKKVSKLYMIDKYSKADFESETFPVPVSTHTDPTGKELSGYFLYEVSVRGDQYDVSLASEPKPVGMAIEDGFFYMFTASGRVFKLNTDLQALSQIETALDGANSKRLPQLDGENYFVYNTGLSISGTEYYAADGCFYVLDVTDANLYRCRGEEFNLRDARNGRFSFADDALLCSIDYENGYGPINRNDANSASLLTPSLYLHQSTGTLLVFFTSSNRIFGFDLNSASPKFDSDFEYGIRGAAYDREGQELYLLYSNVNNTAVYHLTRSADNIYQRPAYRTAATVAFSLAGAGLLASLFLGLTLFVEGFYGKAVTVFKGIWKQKWVYAILLVSLAALAIFCYYPAISSMVLSFFEYTGVNPSKQFNNFLNYQKIFTNPEILSSFKVMLIFLVSDLVLGIVPPLIFAFFLSIMRNRNFSKTARILLFLPSVLPGVASTLIWKVGIFGQNGILNSLIRFFSGNPQLTINFLFDWNWSLPSLIFMGFPWVGSYLIFFGAMMNVPSSYYEAAELEGCGIFRRVFAIDLPLIASQIKYVFVLTFIASVQNFSRVYITTGGAYGTDVPIHQMYQQLLAQNYGLASAYATLLFVFLLAATILNLKLQTVERES